MLTSTLFGTFLLGLTYFPVNDQCPPIKIEVTKNTSWNAGEDYPKMRFAEQRCPQVYGKESRCLLKFIKRGTNNYRAICGPSVINPNHKEKPNVDCKNCHTNPPSRS